jgi:uncharacterized membrane protein
MDAPLDDAGGEHPHGTDDDRRRAEPGRAAFERTRDPSRVLALSDGIFAIVLTLLVLDVHLPDLSGGASVAEALREIRPSLFAFVISFVVASMYWVGHRDLFALIRRTDRLLVWLNVLYLLPVCLLPFATSLLGRYVLEPVALRIYGLLLLAIAVLRVCVWLYATGRTNLLWQPPDERIRRAGLGVTMTPGVIVIVALAFTFLAPLASLLIYAGLPVLYFLSITVLRRGRRRNREFADFT